MAIKITKLFNITASSGPTFTICGQGYELANGGAPAAGGVPILTYANVVATIPLGTYPAIMAFPVYGTFTAPTPPAQVKGIFPQYLKPQWSG